MNSDISSIILSPSRSDSASFGSDLVTEMELYKKYRAMALSCEIFDSPLSC